QAQSALQSRIAALEARRGQSGVSDAELQAIVQQIAARVRAQVLRELQRQDARPLENGTTGRAPASIRETLPSEWSREERERIGRAALRGKKHTISN
ncbi:MAG: hypothetical protein Q4E65_07690, partial [Clostridia bacterium]|nr:hypothetical protein [Clostridia bacterium]